MNTNKLTLIKELEKTALLAKRYKNIEVVNCDRSTGYQLEGGGCLSVIFKALDTTTNKNVAIKFLDPDLRTKRLIYRMELFEREPILLNELAGANRCLQLIQSLTEFDITLTDDNGNSVTIEVSYFVVEWLEEDVLDYTYNQQNHLPEVKLNIFRDMVLAVATLHNRSIFHRDLKPDNFRKKNIAGNTSIITTIDLGTAAKFDSESIGSHSDYDCQVGAIGYAPIEALCGLAGIRKLGVYSDIYALGCILYDLFNYQIYFTDLLNDRGYQNCKAACDAYLVSNTFSNNEKKLAAWIKIINENKGQITAPLIHQNGSTAPVAIKSILNTLLTEMTATLYINRCTDFNRMIRLIDSAKRILRYPRFENIRKKRNKIYKANKVKKVIDRLK